MDALKKRWSPLAFSSRPVERELLQQLFEAARWAPSSFNEQPWRFVYACRDDEAYLTFLDCLVPANRIWAKHAPVLMLTVAKTFYDYKNNENPFALYEAGMAMGNLLAQATEMGLVVHQMGGYSKKMAVEKLGIPEGFEPVAMAAIGYYGDPEKLPEGLREREQQVRTRLAVDAISSQNVFGK